MVGVLFERVHVRHLGQSQQRQQCETQQRGHPETLRFRASIAACIRQKSVQRKIPHIKNTQNWMRWGRTGLQKREDLPLEQATLADPARLNCLAMCSFRLLRVVFTISLAGILLMGCALDAQSRDETQKPLPLQPDLPGLATNHRLILKDGSYQNVRKYEIVGDRVRYISVERGGDWEELPTDLVDWAATRKWEREHANQPEEEASPAMKEAARIDKEEADERAEQKATRPEVAKGLELPDEDSVFVLDTFEGTPELVELLPAELNLNAKTKHGLSTLNPMAGAKASLELDGAHAKVHLHVNDPAIYLSLAGRDDAEKVLSHALTVETGGAKDVANRKHGAHSPQSGFAIVHVDERKAMRIVGAIHMSPTGTVTQDEDVIPTKVEVLAGKHWLKLTAERPLVIGEYALVEIFSASDINQSVWDFRVDPQLGDNPGSMGPILK